MTEAVGGLPSDGSKRPAPLPESVREVLEGLDTGDLILFDRPCSKMGSVIGAIICSTAKVVGGSPFDHIGVVVRDEDGNNVLVEASFSGVAVRPLCERVRRSSASQICVRRLQTNRTEEMRAEACRFVSEVADVPYTNTAPGLLRMAFSSFRYHPAKERRRRMHAETIGLSASISSLEKELAICQSTTERAQVLNDRLRRALTQRRKAQVFLDDAADQERPVTPPSPPPPPPPTTTTTTAARPENGSLPPSSPVPSSPSPPGSLPPSYPAGLTTSYEGGLFCSELVAALYQRLGLFDAPYPARHDYVPADFMPPIGAERDGGRGGGDATKDTIDAEYFTSDGEGRPGDASATASPPLLLDDEIRVALLRGATLEPGQWIRGGPGSASCPPPRPPPKRLVDKEDGERGGEGWGGNPSSSPPPAPSSGTAGTSQPSQRVVLGYVKELGEERETGGGRWLPRSLGFRRSPLNPLAYLPPPTRSNPKDCIPCFASVAPLGVPPSLSQLAWFLHVFSQRAAATATAASSTFTRGVVGLTDDPTVQPREVWPPARNDNEARPERKHWVPAATTTTTALVTVAVERLRTTPVNGGLLLSACTVRQECAEHGVLGCTPTSAAIATAAAAAAAAATAFSAVRTNKPAGRGGRPGAVSMTRGGGGVALALLTVGAACGLASELGPAGDGCAGLCRRGVVVSAPAQRSLS